MTVAGASTDGERLQIGRYHVEARLGEGGMAYAWLCRLHGMKGFSKAFVIKTLKPNCRSQQFVTMFEDEARIGARFEHPNLSRILELGDLNGVPYLVQEFVDGPTLHQIMVRQAARRHIDVAFGARILADVAGALHWVYNLTDDEGRRLNVVHRDISLSNVVVSRQGVAKLIDFGVARFDGRETETEVGMLKGRLRYMAPEVIQRGHITHLSDIYALGICLYSVCAGVAAPSDDRLSRLSEADQTDLDPALAAIVLRCLDQKPSQRWQSALDLKHALEQWLIDRGAGRMGSEDIAERVGGLFPAGPSEWRSEELAVALMKSELTSGFSTVRPAPPRQVLPWVAVGAVLLLLPLGLVALLVLGLVLRTTAPDPTVTALDGAEAALAHGRTGDVEAALTTITAAPLDDGERARLAALVSGLASAEIAQVRAQAATDPAAALAMAQVLTVRWPDNPELDALIASLQAPEPAPVRVAPPPPSPPRPHPAAPAPAPAPASDLFGTRTGRPPAPEPEAP